MTMQAVPQTGSKPTRTELAVWAALAFLGGAGAGWIDTVATEAQATALIIMVVCFALTLPGRAGILWIAITAALGVKFVHMAASGDVLGGVMLIVIVAIIGASGGRFAGRLLDTATGPLDGIGEATATPWAQRASSPRFLLAVALVTIAVLGLPAMNVVLASTRHPAATWLAIVWQIMTLLGWIGLTPIVLRRRSTAAPTSAETGSLGVRPVDVGTHLLFVVLLGVVHAVLIVAMTRVLFIPLLPSARALASAAAVVYLPLDMLAYLAILTLGYLSDANRLRRAADQREAALRAESLDSRLTALRARLNPHFLFNALNSVTVLARSGKSDETASLTEGLTALLRYVLDDRRAMVPLREELAFARRYLAVQQVRFGARLAYLVDADDGADSVLVPQLVLQPIVENAVEHGVARALDGGSVAVRAAVVDGRLHLTVEDDGPEPAGAAPSFGIGLANTRERLDRLYDGRASLTLTPGESGGARVEIVLPIGESATE